MPVKKRRSIKIKRPPVVIEHTEFYPYLLKYNESMQLRGYSKNTLHRRESDIRRFVGWCDERSLNHPNQVTKPILERYQRHLFHFRQERNNQPLSASTQNHYLTSVRQFFKYLTQQNYLLFNPASELQIIKQPPSLPVVLSEQEVAELMQQPNTNKAEAYGIGQYWNSSTAQVFVDQSYAISYCKTSPLAAKRCLSGSAKVIRID